MSLILGGSRVTGDIIRLYPTRCHTPLNCAGTKLLWTSKSSILQLLGGKTGLAIATEREKRKIACSSMTKESRSESLVWRSEGWSDLAPLLVIYRGQTQVKNFLVFIPDLLTDIDKYLSGFRLRWMIRAMAGPKIYEKTELLKLKIWSFPDLFITVIKVQKKRWSRRKKKCNITKRKHNQIKPLHP